VYVKKPDPEGFKSFCLGQPRCGFEPGSTCIVGPNGSGKSNVADALAWVMGEQGAKSLRGGKMEDVQSSPEPRCALPLGPGRGLVDHRQHRRRRADRLHRGHDASRTMFRNGGSEYASTARPAAVGIQDCLSDSGTATRAVIVGQGSSKPFCAARRRIRPRLSLREAAGV